MRVSDASNNVGVLGDSLRSNGSENPAPKKKQNGSTTPRASPVTSERSFLEVLINSPRRKEIPPLDNTFLILAKDKFQHIKNISDYVAKSYSILPNNPKELIDLVTSTTDENVVEYKNNISKRTGIQNEFLLSLLLQATITSSDCPNCFLPILGQFSFFGLGYMERKKKK